MNSESGDISHYHIPGLLDEIREPIFYVYYVYCELVMVSYGDSKIITLFPYAIICILFEIHFIKLNFTATRM